LRTHVLHFAGRCWELLFRAGVFLSQSSQSSRGASATGVTDEQLVAMWQEGNRQAFEALVRRYQHLAFTVCRRYLANDQQAEETAQDVFVNLYRKLGQFRGDASFKSWFYKVLVNHCHNRRKAGMRRREHLHDSLDTPRDRDDPDGRPADLPDPKLDPEHALSELQRQQLIERALQSLDDEERMVLLLREGQGLAYEEIAESLGLALGTVKSRIHRARADLKHEVDRLTGRQAF
jgi:RNA polymerase sigma-70 factor (ECF subfamily)